MAKNRHIPHATAGKKSHSLRAVVLTATLLVCVTAAVQPVQAQSPSATYEVVDGTAYEPARPDGRADEGRFTITLSSLNGVQSNPQRSLTFFFRWTADPSVSDSCTGCTPGYGTPDPIVMNPDNLAARRVATDDFEFILEYTVNGNIVRKELNTTENVYDNRADLVSPRATPNGNGNEVYTFRVVPLYQGGENNDDSNDGDGEFLLFGYRVQFNGIPSSNELKGAVTGGEGSPAIIINEPLPVALYDRTIPNAFEPATDGGMATEGTFTLSLRHLNSDQEAADSVAFFFRFVADSPDPSSPDQTNGFGTLDPGLSSTAHATRDISGRDADFEFILEYTDVTSTPVEITNFSPNGNGNYTNMTPASRAMGDVYTFRVVPLHDNDNDNGPDGEILVFGYRVQFSDIDNSNDLHGQVNGSMPHHLPVIIGEPPPTATYAVGDGTAIEPLPGGADADVGTFTITLSHLSTDQRNSGGRRFFFRFASSNLGRTPGYGTLPSDIIPTDPRAEVLPRKNPREFTGDFTLEYVPDSGAPKPFVFDGSTYNDPNDIRISNPQGNPETYTFRVTPVHDNDFGEGVEHVVFGYRVFFSGQDDEHELTGVVDNREGLTAITITEPPNAVLTRDRVSIKEGDSTPVIFTLALNSVPNGLSTIVYTLDVIKADLQDEDNVAANDISVVFSGTTDPHTGDNNPIGANNNTLGTGSTLTTIVEDGAAEVTIRVTPADDNDTTDEIVVFTITSVEVAGGAILTAENGLICSVCISLSRSFRGDTLNISNALVIRLEDATDPIVSYSRTDNFAIEPPAVGADADAGIFTITLRNVDTSFRLRRSGDRVFTFTLRTADESVGIPNTVPADSNDFDLYAVYTDRDGNPAMEQLYADPANNVRFVTTRRDTASSPPHTNRIPRARRGNNDMGDEEVYDFRIVPKHNADDRMEHVVFRLNTFFGSSGVRHNVDGGGHIDFIRSQSVNITVDNSPASTAVTILEPPLVTLTRDSLFITEGGTGAFIFTLEAIPDINHRAATITYTLAADDQVASVEFMNTTDSPQPNTDGSTSNTFTMPVLGDSNSEARIIINSAADDDQLSGTVTLAVTRVEFASVTITPDNMDNFMCRDCSNVGELSLTILDNAGPEVTATRTIISEVPAQPTATAVISLDLSAINSGHGAGLINVTLPQNINNLALLGVDYTFKYRVGMQDEVPVINAAPVDIVIPSTQLGISGRAIEFTFTSLHDNYDEGEGEDITLNLGPLRFENAMSPFPTRIAPSLPIVTIHIEDDDNVSAALSKGGVAIERGPGYNSVPSTFVLTLTEAPEDSTATVTYTLDNPDNDLREDMNTHVLDDFGTKYTATLEGGGIGESLSDFSESVFTIPKNNITGTTPGIEGGESGNAEATIVIHPLLDSDDTLVPFGNTRYLQVDHENVRLTIHSIRFDNGVEVGNIRNGAQTIAIRDASLTEFILNDTDTSEPLTAGATADPGTFTLRLYNLNQAQQASPLRRFFFRFAPNSDGRSISHVVFGYNDRGTLPDDINAAESSDFRLDYLPPNAAPVPLVLDVNLPDNYASQNITTDSLETYVFRVTPNHDGEDESTEHIVFGYRVFFGSASDTDQIRGFVTGNDADPPVASITDGPSAVLTRNTDSIDEAGSAGSFTFTLTNFDTTVRDASIRYIITVTNTAGTSDTSDIRSPVGFTVGTTSTFTTNLNNGNAAFDIDITPNPAGDDDSDNEMVTLTIISVAVGGLTFNSNDIRCGEGEGDDLVIDECRPAGALSIIIIDGEPPVATYALTGPGTAIEPTSLTADNAVASAFTITLSDLNEFQRNADNLAFFFKLTSGPSDPDPGSTPGYGTPDPIMVTNTTSLATRRQAGDDFEFILAYRTETGNFVTREFESDSNSDYTNDGDRAPKAENNEYTFRVVPLYDNEDDEGLEFLLFGYRVSFDGDRNHQNELRGMVNGGVGDPAITIDDGARVTLTRDEEFITEDTNSTAALTFALSNVPNGPVTIASMITITGGTTPSVDDFNAQFVGEGVSPTFRYVDTTGFLEDPGGTGSFMINITDNAADYTYTLNISPRNDGDSDNETITYAITRIELPNNLTLGPGDFVCNACASTGKLSITIRDDETPAVKYALTGPETASEPISAAVDNAVASSFTITLSNLKARQKRSDKRRFFFRFASDANGFGISRTPGYGSLHRDLRGATPANLNDFNLDIVYTPAGNTTVTELRLDRRTSVYDSPELFKAGETEQEEEVYTFRLTPRHDPGDNAGIEHVVFGYRVFFVGGVPNQAPGQTNRLDGMVNGFPSSTPVMAIADGDGPRVTLKRNGVSITEGTDSSATFTLELRNAPNDRTTIIARVEMTGDNPHAGDYMPLFSGAENNETLRIQLEPINSQSTILGGAIGSDANPGLFVINTTNNTADFNLHIRPGEDNLGTSNGDATDEVVTFIFDRIEFPEFTFGLSDLMSCVGCMGVRGSTVRNSLSIDIIDDDLPKATYALTGRGTAIEPTSRTARNAVASSFTITLSNLNTAQTTTSNARRFFFNFEPSDHGLNPRDRTPGYGSPLPPGLQGAAIANMDDFDLDIVYTPAGNTTVTVVSLDRRIGVYDTPNVDKAGETDEGEEVYTFRLTPRYDNNVDEGIEHVVFGYRVFFAGGVPDQVPGGENRLNGVVNGGDGDPAITIDDGPRVTLTRDPDSITEGTTNSSATLTLTLDNVPNGKSTITSTITITGDNPSENDIVTVFTGPDNTIETDYTDTIPPTTFVAFSDVTDFFTITITNNTAAFTLNISPAEHDDDSDNEIITYAITSIKLPNLTLGPRDFVCEDCSSAGALSIDLIDDDLPEATYALTGRGTTIEPTSGAARNAVASSFTITLSDLNTSQTTTSSARRFFFRFESSGFLPTDSPDHTPGYGSLHSNLAGAAPANTSDLNLEVVYTPAGNTTLTVASLARGSNTHESGNLPKAGETDEGEEVYTFRLTPRHDNNVDEGMEHVVFGYRVFFAGGVPDQARGEANRLDGVVSGGPGDPAITIVDGARVTLTRDPAFITEGTNSPAILTFALGNVPNGKSTITSTITITGDNPSTSDFEAQFEGMGANAEIRYVGTTGFLEDRRDTGSFIIDITDDNPAGFTLNISPLQDDDDSDDERITYAITSIKLPNLTLGPRDFVCSACDSDGELSIRLIDNEIPAATYALIAPGTASEPISAAVDNAVASSFTITLSDLNARQKRSPGRRFFFRFAPDGNGFRGFTNFTPGYGSLHPSLEGAATATLNDFNLDVVYKPAGNTTVTVIRLNRGDSVYNSNNLDKAGATAEGEEVYTFRLTPRHDPGDNAGIEHVVFGYRVFFTEGVPNQEDPDGENRLDGMVNGAPSTPAMTIADGDGPRVELTLNRPSITEGTEGTDSSATFTLALSNAPNDRTTIIAMVEMTGDNPHAGDYMPSFSGAENSGTLRIQLEPINSQSTILGGAIESVANPGLFVINTTNNTADFNFHVRPGNDNLGEINGDATDETVTFIFGSIEFPEFTFFPVDIRCSACSTVRSSTVRNSLSLTIRDDDIPKATYALIAPGTAIEPTSLTAGNAVASSFTISLSNLNTDQTTSSHRRFFFRFESSGFLPTNSTDHTPGYGSLHSNLAGAAPANTNDLNLEVVYTPAGNTTLTVASLARGNNTHESGNLPKAGETDEGEEVYTFRLTPRHDNNVNEGREHVVFGYRVFFSSTPDQAPGGENRLNGVMNGGPGGPAITIDDGARVTLTRDQPSITEGTTDSATLTLALDNVPNGKSTITSTITITGDAPSTSDFEAQFEGMGANAEIRYVGTTGFLEDRRDTGSFIIDITDDNPAGFTLNISPGNNGDLDSDNERITYAITSIKLPNLTLGPRDFVCDDCNPGNPAGTLSITLIDSETPAATYALTGPGTAFEPTSANADDAVASSFTITLSDLNTDQTTSSHRRFFFRFESSGFLPTNSANHTPGYGSLHPNLAGAAPANTNDLNLEVVYTPAGNTTLTVIPLDRESNTHESRNLSKAGETVDGEEVYTFRLTPRHDNNVDEGIEYVVFGYRVFFSSTPDQIPGGDNRLDGVVNGFPSSTPVMTIDEASINIIRLRIRTFLEGALQ